MDRPVAIVKRKRGFGRGDMANEVRDAATALLSVYCKVYGYSSAECEGFIVRLYNCPRIVGRGT